MSELPSFEDLPPDAMAGFIRRIQAGLGSPNEAHTTHEARLSDMSRPQETTLQGFEPYRVQMNAIDELLSQGVAPEDIPGYVTAGGVCLVFETLDGRILKLPRKQPRAEDESDYVEPLGSPMDYILPLEIGQGEEGFEQLVGATAEVKGGIVCEDERKSGRLLTDLTPEEKDAIPLEHHYSLMRLSGRIAELGLMPDYDTDNIFYSPQKGFTLIDYALRHPSRDTLHEPADFARAFAKALLQGTDRRESLPAVGTAFFKAYRNTFGEEAVAPLLYMWHKAGTAMPEGYHRPSDVLLPENIDVLLRARVPVRVSPDNIQEFVLPGHPHLLARLSRRNAQLEVELAKEATDSLTRHDVHVAPWLPVTVNQRTHAVVQRVRGIGLEEALAAGPSTTVMDAIDETLSGVCVNLMMNTIAFDGRPLPKDIANLRRYTVGALAGEQDIKVWLTDLPDTVLSPDDPGVYEAELVRLANSVSCIEAQTGHTLLLARQKIISALVHCEGSELFGDACRRAVTHVLNTGQLIPESEDFAERILRFYTRQE